MKRAPTSRRELPKRKLHERGAAADRVYERLRAGILAGSIAPRQRLREVDVGRRFGVSRTPAREALQRLETEGWLERDGNGGLTVSAATTREVVEVYVLREVLEGVATRLATARASETDLLMLEGCFQRMNEALVQGAPDRALALSNQFHSIIWQIAGNRQLTRIMNDLNVSLQRFARVVAQYPENMTPRFSDHAELLEAIRRRDPQSAEEVARAHMRRVRDRRIELMLQQIEATAGDSPSSPSALAFGTHPPDST